MSIDGLLESVRSLAPLVEAERRSLDGERELSPRLIEPLMEAGLFRLWAPKELGGAELDPVSGLRVIAAVSALDGSVGWNVMISSAYSFFAGRLSARAAEQIYGGRRAVVAGQLGARGEGRYGRRRLSREWPLAFWEWLQAGDVVPRSVRGARERECEAGRRWST